jgi:two-component system chemotaxis response regulator CheB
MPRMDGLATLEAALSQHPLPIIMVSALTQRAADITLKALEIGAVDYIAKPDGENFNRERMGQELIRKIRVMAGTDVARMMQIRRQKQQRSEARGLGEPQPKSASVTRVTGTNRVPDRTLNQYCVAIGISTGGPPALGRVFAQLAPPLPPIVIVQHMPAQFTPSFAARLDSLTSLTVVHADQPQTLQPNHVYLAPGGRHLVVQQRGMRVQTKTVEGEPVSSHRPSVDVMFQSVAECFGEKVLGIIMTGMGYDGVAGCQAIKAAGGSVLGQNEASSDVYGMNKAAWVQGFVDRQFDLDDLPRLIRTHALGKPVHAQVADVI